MLQQFKQVVGSHNKQKGAIKLLCAEPTVFHKRKKSMMDFMPGKSEHETGVFLHFYGKSGATSWRYVHVNVMSHININKFKMVEQRLLILKCMFFLEKGLWPKY